MKLETTDSPDTVGDASDQGRIDRRTKWVRLSRHGRARYLRFRRSFPRLIRSDEIWLVTLAGIVGIGAGLIVDAMIGVSRVNSRRKHITTRSPGSFETFSHAP